MCGVWTTQLKEGDKSKLVKNLKNFKDLLPLWRHSAAHHHALWHHALLLHHHSLLWHHPVGHHALALRNHIDLWMRSSRMVRASVCRSRNSPGLYPSLRQQSGDSVE
jgi:hypothetical protein